MPVSEASGVALGVLSSGVDVASPLVGVSVPLSDTPPDSGKSSTFTGEQPATTAETKTHSTLTALPDNYEPLFGSLDDLTRFISSIKLHSHVDVNP